jgi:Cu+-exporting ATPase
VDESAITGEFTPREAGVGDEVPAGAILADGLLTIEATRVGAESAIGRVLRAVEDAQAGGTRMQRIADRVAGIFVPIVIVIAFITLVGNGATASFGWMEGVRRAVAVLVIACPCAMGLATPVAVMVAVGAAAGRGILVRDAAALEMSGQIDTMLLDKTGTITTGRPMVAEVFALAGATGPGNHKNPEDSLLQLAASAEQYAQHPLARAVVRAAELRGLSLSEPAAFENESGFGVRAVIDRREVRVGSVAYLRRSGIDIDSVRVTIDRLTGQGITVIVVAEDGRCMGVIAVRDEIRPNAAEAIRNIFRLGIHVAMVTGDTAETARAVAAQVGLDDVYARLAPEEKLAVVRRLQNEGRRVAFTGDGINDAPALAAADVGITFASATDIAVGAADITIIHDDLERLPCVVAIGRRSVRIIRQNLFWAFVYNVIAIPLAATGKIPPGYAAGAMMASSISVVLNSLRLRNQRIRFAGGAGA